MMKTAYTLILTLLISVIYSNNCYSLTDYSCKEVEYPIDGCNPQEYADKTVYVSRADDLYYEKDTSQLVNGIVKGCNKGQLIVKCVMNGKIEGILRIYKDGEIHQEWEFKDGKRHGYSKRYYPTGIIQEAALFDKGNPLVVRVYYPSSALGRETKYSNYRVISDIFYDEKGEVINEKKFAKLYPYYHNNNFDDLATSTLPIIFHNIDEKNEIEMQKEKRKEKQIELQKQIEMQKEKRREKQIQRQKQIELQMEVQKQRRKQKR